MSEITRIFISGFQQLIPFDPRVSFNLVYSNKDLERLFSDLKRNGISDKYKPFFDPYFKREIEKGFFSEVDPEYASRLELFRDVSVAIWSPLYDHQMLFK